MKILAIDTSCDETSVAITQGQKVISNVLFSQIKIHAPFGGVFPSLAKREHLTKIKPAVSLALKRAGLIINKIEAIAVTFGPGLPPALEVGVNFAKALSQKYQRPLIPVDHLEGHIYSGITLNQMGKPKRQFRFPLLALIVSGGHTQLVLMNNHINYKVVGQTLDDACGEALDKAGRLMGLGYPGGPIIERLAKSGNINQYSLPIPMLQHQSLDFSFSGLKTAFKRLIYSLDEKQKLEAIPDLCASFQQAVFTSLLIKLEKAIKQFQPKLIVVGGGVSANKELRKQLRTLLAKKIPVYFPPLKKLTGDNAAMIGVVAYFKYQKGIYLTHSETLDRLPRTNLDNYIN
ncbi:tRNA (adenosine(37)-N6)-threonylcarbamoyltransferase complex transferase subunit TsaD [Candidatus Roizmanbacteria bacterium RIFOXYB2_FULL_41_10]|uniref:tRNA N6-adenosine threonylcarbamoyltransferase n=1 Tax=Candidatus Roizmanbacteria bacterium RIFOXYA1_FULL_41_12 TaxID=1802082 RepID=A0A1F7K5R3_9BACT|nr:MAG: tRNA (adenosine(37)-N6)-threonylcarbamoyltransferase complex transferase subunit TsaD [Candidatus Roizmanbacteria bacterium RIFOXYA1_FULL_41_12]OGK66675.1 MAG: tRNA (adenosine(37)-N6)-threonylcarbamoyltransferase complex transferase subunit TsaD [Candidatus Roizmanbacteria bacterium RIFOXYA2_FULL_41_8]OGK67531.1 MAG: tRNA (adenosine(37)-N6)-threonylcarbamoyltransferase complex transferase subunit TsaD [Candidatus Roizmanbacteria bacterium RIFOXYB1_FULL_41_27]OGK70938.1 MAG: tRNA (adenosi